MMAASLLGACNQMEPPSAEEGQSIITAPTSGMDIGVVTGAIYDFVPEPLSTDYTRIFCDLRNLGVSWIRIESNWTEGGVVSDATYQTIVREARRAGLNVIVLVNHEFCPAQMDASTFIDDFVNHGFPNEPNWHSLSYLATNVFNAADTQPNAYEILNEPNVYYGAPTGSCSSSAHFRVDGATFASLLRTVWQWKTNNSRSERIISGGTLNTYWDAPTEQSFWGPFLSSSALAGGAPFDYMGVHPYNWPKVTASGDQCLASNGSGCFGQWISYTQSSLVGLASTIRQKTGTGNVMLFATEFGWGIHNAPCTIDNDPNLPSVCTPSTCIFRPAHPGYCDVNTEAQQAEGMQAAVDAFRGSGVVAGALWHQYRDFVDSQTGALVQLGLRHPWNGSTYPARTTTWDKLRDVAGGQGTDPDICWTPTTGQIFEDVLPGDTFYAEIQCMAQHGIIGGYACGGSGEPCDSQNRPYFRPGNQVTRGQFSKMLAGSMGWTAAASPEPPYSDVSTADTFYTYIKAGYQHGIQPEGNVLDPAIPAGTFQSSWNLTRKSMAKMITEANGWPLSYSGSHFADCDGSSNYMGNMEYHYWPYAEQVATHQSFSGYNCGGTNTFVVQPAPGWVPPPGVTPGPEPEPCDANNRPYLRPDNPTSRGQASKILAHGTPLCTVCGVACDP